MCGATLPLGLTLCSLGKAVEYRNRILGGDSQTNSQKVEGAGGGVEGVCLGGELRNLVDYFNPGSPPTTMTSPSP